MSTPIEVTLEDMIKAIGREIGMRKWVYPKHIKKGKLTVANANKEIAAMQCVYHFLKEYKQMATDHPELLHLFSKKVNPVFDE